MNVGQVDMINPCSCINNFRTSMEVLGRVIHLVFFFFNDLSLFELQIASQDDCHILFEVCFVMLLVLRHDDMVEVK